MSLTVATSVLYRYLLANDKVNGFALDEARMLARDAALPVDPTPNPESPAYPIGYSSWGRKHEVVLSRLHDTFSACEEYGFTRSKQFQALWDDVILQAVFEGYDVSSL